MNFRRVFRSVGGILLIEGVFLLLPVIPALVYGEFSMILSFIIPAAALAAVGFGLYRIPQKNAGYYAKEGFFIVGLSWVLMALFGALPFVISGVLPHYVDALFESASGFTTTGATMFPIVENLPKSILFWRAETHWIGGMGILVFMLAILPDKDGSTIHIFRAESPGTNASKLVSRMKFTAGILYVIYLALTVLEAIFLAFDMSFFDAICHAFSTAGTGGFSTFDSSLAARSPYTQWVVTAFMLLFSLNFSLYYLALVGNFRAIFKNEELRLYLCIVVFAIVAVTLNIMNAYDNFWEALRIGSFQVMAVASTTGFFIADYAVFPIFARVVLLILMVIGSMGGSTGGGIKVSRLGIMAKSALKDLKRSVRPNKVYPVVFEGKILTREEVRGVRAYLFLYLMIVFVSMLLVSLFCSLYGQAYELETVMTSVVTSMSNVGPAFGTVEFTGYFAGFNAPAKVVLILDMLLGRLEIIPILVLFSKNAISFR